MAEETRDDHRSFLNRYYGVSRHFYDLTRKYYLFGRDVAIRDLLAERWERLIEVGSGTGRNLAQLHEQRPGAIYGGVDASDEMLKHLVERYPWAKAKHGFAEDAELANVLGEDLRPERILFSYTLSMVKGQEEALANARKALAPGGKVVVVDFTDCAGLPSLARRGLHRWLNTFHVHPLDPALLERAGAKLRFGPGRYYVIGEISAEG